LELNDEALVVINCVIEIDAGWDSYMQRAAVNRSLGNMEECKLDEFKTWEFGHDFNIFQYLNRNRI